MPLKTFFMHLVFILNALQGSYAQAEQATLKPFASGSYQQLLASNSNTPFMMVIWSVTCSSCLKDMALLNAIHKSKPELKIIMLTTDDSSDSVQIQQILEKNQLAALENWIYAEENTQKLQYEIDPKWYGELPRTYFFDRTHQRTGVSGVMSKDDYEDQIAKIQQ
ncbi:MAG: hypothetical protein HOP23_08215 [Methylococcaceae bacterium]|nr:hypothetical protein [Methylococcaceae bacterium]